MSGKNASRDQKAAKGFEMRNERNPNGASTRETMQKMQKGARWMDIALCVVFAVVAFRSHGGWAWFWGISSAFCAFTAATSPMEKVFNWAQRRFLGVKPQS